MTFEELNNQCYNTEVLIKPLQSHEKNAAFLIRLCIKLFRTGILNFQQEFEKKKYSTFILKS